MVRIVGTWLRDILLKIGCDAIGEGQLNVLAAQNICRDHLPTTPHPPFLALILVLLFWGPDEISTNLYTGCLKAEGARKQPETPILIVGMLMVVYRRSGSVVIRKCQRLVASPWSTLRPSWGKCGLLDNPRNACLYTYKRFSISCESFVPFLTIHHSVVSFAYSSILTLLGLLLATLEGLATS